MLITWFKFLIIARKAAETAGIYDHAKDVHDPSNEGRTSKALFYDTVILRLDHLVIERLSTITDCGFSNPATSTFEKEDAAELVTECRTSYFLLVYYRIFGRIFAQVRPKLFGRIFGQVGRNAEYQKTTKIHVFWVKKLEFSPFFHIFQILWIEHFSKS